MMDILTIINDLSRFPIFIRYDGRMALVCALGSLIGSRKDEL